MKQTYCYLVHLESLSSKQSIIVDLEREIEEKDLAKLKKDVEKERKEKHLVISVSLLNRKWKESPEELEQGAFIVRNIETNKSLHFNFRSEALDHFNFLVSEQGKGSEIELLLRIRHHIPSELPSTGEGG